MSRENAVVTVDGPAGSGKSTTAREVARRLGYRHLDSGALYRALTFALLSRGIGPDRWPALTSDDLTALGVRLEAAGSRLLIRYEGRVLSRELRTPAVTARVSELSSYPQVRNWLLEIQRAAGEHGGLVTDGRDMGSVVFPDADIKIFLIADPTERAKRRLAQEGGSFDDPLKVADALERITDRDRRDSDRPISPLIQPDDAILLDTTHLGFEEQVQAVVDLVREWERPTGG
jgi:cytidylate kinase